MKKSELIIEIIKLNPRYKASILWSKTKSELIDILIEEINKNPN